MASGVAGLAASPDQGGIAFAGGSPQVDVADAAHLWNPNATLEALFVFEAGSDGVFLSKERVGWSDDFYLAMVEDGRLNLRLDVDSTDTNHDIFSAGPVEPGAFHALAVRAGDADATLWLDHTQQPGAVNPHGGLRGLDCPCLWDGTL